MDHNGIGASGIMLENMRFALRQTACNIEVRTDDGVRVFREAFVQPTDVDYIILDVEKITLSVFPRNRVREINFGIKHLSDLVQEGTKVKE